MYNKISRGKVMAKVAWRSGTNAYESSMKKTLCINNKKLLNLKLKMQSK